MSVAADAKKCYATGRGIQPKGNRVGEEALFNIYTEGAGGGNGEPRVMIMGPGGSPEKNTLTKANKHYTCTYKPIKPGLYIVTVQYVGQPIQKSPFRVDVAPMKTSKVRAYGPGLKTGMVGHPATFRVVPHGEPGQLGRFMYLLPHLMFIFSVASTSFHQLKIHRHLFIS